LNLRYFSSLIAADTNRNTNMLARGIGRQK